MTVECLAHYDSFLFAKKDMALEKANSPSLSANTVSDRYSTGSGNRRNDGWVCNFVVCASAFRCNLKGRKHVHRKH